VLFLEFESIYIMKICRKY